MVTGEKRCLQQSASYPLQFGLAIAALISPHGVPPATPERVQTSIGDRLWYHDMVFISSFYYQIYRISMRVFKGDFPKWMLGDETYILKPMDNRKLIDIFSMTPEGHSTLSRWSWLWRWWSCWWLGQGPKTCPVETTLTTHCAGLGNAICSQEGFCHIRFSFNLLGVQKERFGTQQIQ